MRFVALGLLVLGGCDRVTIAFGTAPFDSGTSATDADHDGVPASVDCDDEDPDVGGTGPEAWNGRDDDCNGLVDDLAAGNVALGVVTGPVADTRIGDEGGLALGGDLTDDAIPDLAVGSWTSGAGQLWVVGGAGLLGASGTVSAFDPLRVYGAVPDEPFGYVSAGAMGDVTGDGVDDLLVAAVDPLSPESPGVAFLLPGSVYMRGTYGVQKVTYAYFAGDSAGDRLWRAVAADIDADGLDDVITGSPWDQYVTDHGGASIEHTGNVAVFTGDHVYPHYFYALAYADEQIHGAGPEALLGWALAAADLDDDGYADILAGAPGANPPSDAEETGDDRDAEKGAVYLFPGNRNASWGGDDTDAARLTIYADRGTRELGGAPFATPGDLDGDGHLDLALADPGASVRLWYAVGALTGTFAWSEADAALDLGDDCGRSLASDVDLEGDGRDELIVGCPGASGSGPETGAVRVYAGLDLVAEITGDAADDRFGAALTKGADVDGRGGEEFAVGAPGSDRSAADAGAVYLLGRHPEP